MRHALLLAAVAALGLAAPLPLAEKTARAEGVATRSDVMSVKDLKPGMKGYGLTVFEGTKPEKFDVEILGVLRSFLPKQELILIRTTHPRLEVAKVVAGMSGSPIFIDGKMIGAYAYGWTFGVETVAGVTPIRNMLDDLERPLPRSIDGWPLTVLPRGAKVERRTAARSQGRFAGPLAQYDLVEHGKQLAAARKSLLPTDLGVSSTASTTPLLVGGLPASAVGTLRDLVGPLGLEPLQAGGAGTEEADAPTRYVDGGAIGVQLVRGDMSAMGLGTVTRVEGDKLVGFGHPMLQAGYTALPTAIGRVVWFMATQMRSFKLGYPVRPVGAMIGDRQASIVASHSAKAPVIPVKLKVKGAPGAPYTNWSFEVAHEKFMAPMFMAIAMGTAMQATASERSDVSWTAKSVLRVKGHGEIVSHDFGVSVGGTPEPGEFFRTGLIRSAGVLLNNPWEPVILESAEMEMELRFAREITRLRGVELLEPELDPGQPARLRLTLIPWAGKATQKVITVPIPRRFAGQTVSLSITPGYLHNPELADPESLGELVANLGRRPFEPRSLVVTYAASGGAVAYRGRIARNLPPGAVDRLRPSSTSIGPDLVSPPERIFIPLDDYLIGGDSVTVRVRPALK